MGLVDVISSARKNKKAKELVASAEKMIADVDSEIVKTDERLESDLAEYNTLRDAVRDGSIKTFDDTYLQIQNVDFKGSIVTYTNEEMEDIGDAFCKCKYEIEPVVIKRVNTGMPLAIAVSLIVGALLLATALSIASSQTAVAISTETPPSLEQIKTLLAWFGAGSTQSVDSDALVGGGILLAILLVVMSITGYLLVNRKSKKNLKAAEEKFSEVTAIHLEKSSENRKAMSMAEFIEQMHDNLKTLQVYLDEFNAVLARIIHIEGTDYAAYSITSQRDVHMALSIYKRVKALIGTRVVTNEGTVNSSSRQEVERGSEFIKELAQKWR